MEKIYHVFISSTYADLKDERKVTSEAVAKAGYVAEGMEIFPASSQTQMTFIKNVINRCDYYILILGGRYGSISKEDGISYTELEYRYALSRQIPILAFVHKSPDTLSKSKKDIEPEKIEKLARFQSELLEGKLADFWNTSEDLAYKALAALSQEVSASPSIGWVRGDKIADPDILFEIHDLKKKNETLNKQIKALKPKINFGDLKIADLDDKFDIRYKVSGRSYTETISLTWAAIFAAIGPNFRTPSNTSSLEYGITRFIRDELPSTYKMKTVTIDMRDKETILIQFEALGLMVSNKYSVKNGGKHIFYELTQLGHQTYIKSRVILK